MASLIEKLHKKGAQRANSSVPTVDLSHRDTLPVPELRDHDVVIFVDFASEIPGASMHIALSTDNCCCCRRSRCLKTGTLSKYALIMRFIKNKRLLSNSGWRKRRMVITKEKLAFAFINDDTELDRIHFADVNYIKDLTVDGPAVSEGSGHGTLRFEIGTKSDGYNSGRTYHIRMNANNNHSRLIKTLGKNVKDEAKKQSSFSRRLQSKMCFIYNTDVVQSLIALIIMAVISSKDLLIDQSF